MDAFTQKDGLLLGAALGATQCLGGEVESSWIYWWGLGYIRDHASPAVAAQHAAHWREDVELLRSLNAQAVRLGVDWTRIEPNEGEFDEAELARCREEAAALRSAGIRVTLVLHQFTDPAWFVERGGFEREENLPCFLSYVEHVAAALGALCSDYLTFAEPNAYAVGGYLGGDYPPGKRDPSACYRVLTHMSQCHILARDLLRQLHAAMEFSPCRVSVSLRAQAFTPANPANAAQRLLCAAAQRSFDAAFRAFYLGQTRLPMKYNKYLVPGKYCDFLALDWYGRCSVSAPLDLTPFAKRDTLGSPERLSALLQTLHTLAPLPLRVSLAGVDDEKRISMLGAYLRTLSALALPVEECCCAPLLDGFEWLDGSAKRYGLVHVDAETQARTLKPSGEFFRALASHEAIELSQ